jgi:phosphatidylglycerol phospholipase C
MDYLPICQKYLPLYPITHIGYSLSRARKYLKFPGVCFNMFLWVLIGPFGSKFMRDVRVANRPLFVWTVNNDEMMRWCIKKDVSGVITDNPKRFLDICKSYKGEKVRVPWKIWANVLFIAICEPLIGPLWLWRKRRAARSASMN